MGRDERNKEKWGKIKSKGLLAYVIKMGLLYYGLSFFLIWVLLVPYIDNNFSFGFLFRETFKPRLIIFSIVAPLFGILLGYIDLKHVEKNIKNNKSDG